MGETREEKRARLRMEAGVSTRGVEVPAVNRATALVNRAGAATTETIEALLAEAGGTVGALALILEGVMLNAAWHLWSNSPDVRPEEFRAAFARLSSAAADEVLGATENPAGETPAGLRPEQDTVARGPGDAAGSGGKGE